MNECFDISKYSKFKKHIEASNLTPEVKKFLIIAATRHIAFRYDKIADYYASADRETQQLMEESALVIIDMNDAIANGYVRLNKAIDNIIQSRKEQSDEE